MENTRLSNQINLILKHVSSLDLDELMIYVSTYDLNLMSKFDWEHHLQNEPNFECDVVFQSVKIGTIKLINFKEYKLFDVVYSKPIKHEVHTIEYDPYDGHYKVSAFDHNGLEFYYEAGIKHPFKSDWRIRHKIYANYDCPFNYTFNAIVLDNNKLNFISIFNKEKLEEGELSRDPYPNDAFHGYHLEPATIESAFKSLLLLHLVVDKL
jgi:hypothetical protein